MVFSLEHDVKVTKNHQNLLPTQSVIVAHTVPISNLGACKIHPVEQFSANNSFSEGSEVGYNQFQVSHCI
jgi:hypothetical protein